MFGANEHHTVCDNDAIYRAHVLRRWFHHSNDPFSPNQRDRTLLVTNPDVASRTRCNGRREIGGQSVGDREVFKVSSVKTIHAALRSDPKITGGILRYVNDAGLGQAIECCVKTKR